MVASRSTPPVIDLADLDGPLAEAIRGLACGSQTIQLTDAGRPLAQITPIRAVDAPAPDAERPAVGAGTTDDQRADVEEGRRLLAEAWERRRAFTAPDTFDQDEHDRLTKERHALAEALGTVFPPGTDAVEIIREQRRGSWER